MSESEALEGNEPVIVKKRAIDVTPYEHGIWCSIMDGKPFVNEICIRRWSEDGSKITFMLESHNFLFADPGEEIDVVVIDKPAYSAKFLEDRRRDDTERMKNRPVPPRPMCPEGQAAIDLLMSQGFSVDDVVAAMKRLEAKEAK